LGVSISGIFLLQEYTVTNLALHPVKSGHGTTRVRITDSCNVTYLLANAFDNLLTFDIKLDLSKMTDGVPPKTDPRGNIACEREFY